MKKVLVTLGDEEAEAAIALCKMWDCGLGEMFVRAAMEKHDEEEAQALVRLYCSEDAGRSPDATMHGSRDTRAGQELAAVLGPEGGVAP